VELMCSVAAVYVWGTLQVVATMCRPAPLRETKIEAKIFVKKRLAKKDYI